MDFHEARMWRPAVTQLGVATTRLMSIPAPSGRDNELSVIKCRSDAGMCCGLGGRQNEAFFSESRFKKVSYVERVPWIHCASLLPRGLVSILPTGSSDPQRIK